LNIKSKNQIDKKSLTRQTTSDSKFRFSSDESELIARIKKLQKSDSNVAFAKRCGISEGGLRQILNGRSPNLDTLSKIARANGVRVSELVGGAPLDVSFHPEEKIVEFAHPAEDGFVAIDHYVDVRGSAGPGTEVGEEAIIKVRMDARLLRERIGSNFSRIKIAAVSGDSMEPTLSHGDQVLVDTACTRFVDNAIYAIQQDGHLRFKRIALNLDGSIEVKSDASSRVETYSAEVAARFVVVGMVIPFKFGRFKV